MDKKYSDITLQVDLSAVKHNYELLAKSAGKALCSAVVKANAYGLGVNEIANTLYSAGCRNFFVATLDEALELLDIIAPDAKIYVFHGVKRGEEGEFADKGLIPVINDFYQLEVWADQAKQDSLKLPAILHFDTGMNRLGFNWQDAQQVSNHGDLRYLDLKYIMSHLACIVEDEHSLNKEQLNRTREVHKNFLNKPVSLANSKGIIAGAEYHFDLVRPGSAIYGVKGSCKSLNLKPVVHAKAKILQLREVLQDGFVGYGATKEVKKGTRIAVCPLGYADGYLRSLTNNSYAYYNGQKVPLIGRVSMDMTIFDVSDIPSDKINHGSELEFMGANHTVDDLARDANTIGYEILTNLGCRYNRIYKA